MADLARLHCTPLEGHAAMSAGEIGAHLANASGWALVQGSIEKRYSFKNYHETMAFVNALAWIAHAQDHHPELAVSYAACTVRFNTHSAGGISVNDFICAARLDALFA